MDIMKAWILFTAAVVLFGISCTNRHDALTERAFGTLEEVLTGGRPWEKVHAAEFLIDLGQTGMVRDVFMAESAENGHIPEYRIGIWRVLYKCAGEWERQAWQDSIRRAFTLPDSPDRIHAVETLAKLKIPAEQTDAGVIEAAVASTDYRLVFYTQWWELPQQENGAEKLKEHLFRIIRSDSENPARKLAAYVLSKDRDVCLNAEEWQLLENLALARREEAKNREILEQQLEHPENEVRIAAAYAILKTDNQKQP